MAADSPPDVHQWITVAFSGSACAALLAATAATAAMTLTTSFFMLFIESPPEYVFHLAPWFTGSNGVGIEIELRVRHRPWHYVPRGTSQPVRHCVSWCASASCSRHGTRQSDVHSRRPIRSYPSATR